MNTQNCPKCGGLGKIETMVDCECVSDKAEWDNIKRILLEYGVKVEHIQMIKEWHEQEMD